MTGRAIGNGSPTAEAVGEDCLRVLVADDQDVVRSGFRLILSSYDGLAVVGEARNGEEAVEAARALRPDVVLMDVRMPVKNGIEATRDIRNDPRLSSVRVLVLTTFDIDEVRVRRALCRRERLSAQGRRTRRHSGRHPGGGPQATRSSSRR